MNYQIKVFEASTGKSSFKEWLNNLSDKKMRAALISKIERLEIGNFG